MKPAGPVGFPASLSFSAANPRFMPSGCLLEIGDVLFQSDRPGRAIASTKTVVKLSTPPSVCLPKPVVGGLDAGNTAGPPLFYKSKSKIWTQVQVKIV